MRAVGLITEYNPFHNGHLYHLRRSLELADAEVAVAVMSGPFLQRGEPALIDKWARAEMALAAGVDVVVELPLPWACSSAPDFARGGIQALTALGVDACCFGSESGNLNVLQGCADLLADAHDIIEQRTSAALRRGVTFPQARAQALADLCPEADTQEMFVHPNNILGLAYLRALREVGSPVVPLTLTRIGAGYHDLDAKEGIASATGIRQCLLEGLDIDRLVPDPVAHLLRETFAEGMGLDEDVYFRMLSAQIVRQANDLTRYWWIEAGLEHRLIAAADQSAQLEELISNIKARHLTRTRVQRALVAVLLGIEAEVARQLLAASPAYLHLLAVSDQGERFLAERRTLRTIPLIQNFSRIQAILKRRYDAEPEVLQRAQNQLDLQVRASRIYSLLQKNFVGQRQRDYFESLRRGGKIGDTIPIIS
ncbi:nucleotidyltransferase family protein [Pelovirga terrestris]|uniref:tRNA(Met) cytidine acetate ligase n=1 Tax=Pelovirga terrestris TaxID=2771352 RepID=A0A8J6QWI8_9BACT|nr:nucleotidyltransferase family protein [Pelovirga terrestris]MBD1399738.1 nucleotidyltransferase family protein [Pelovirga terrestris]